MLDNVIVRTGTIDDLDAAFVWAEEAIVDNAFVEPDRKLVISWIYGALTLQNGIMGIIGDPGNKIEGAILLTVGKLFYSKDDCLEERTMFVPQEFRSAKGGRGKKLCDFAKKAAKDLSMPLSIGVLSNTRTKGKVRLFQREFGDPAGIYFLYNAKTGIPGYKLNVKELFSEGTDWLQGTD